MNQLHFKPSPFLTPLVRAIFVLEDQEAKGETRLPFYADGFPGIMYQEANKMIHMPANKVLDPFILYGQTIEAMELVVDGPYKIIAFQLYPFAARVLLGVNPKTLNDGCFNLLELNQIDTSGYIHRLNTSALEDQKSTISNYLDELTQLSSANPDHQIQLAVNLILNKKGQINVSDLREKLHLSERTFERRFTNEIGITPKQFAKIIQFDASLNQLSEEDYVRLTDVSYENGYADQSHFIRNFKQFTGQTPKGFYRQFSTQMK